MNMLTKIAIGVSVVVVLSILAYAGHAMYTKGKLVAKLECEAEKAQVQVQTVEVIKYVTKTEAKIYAKPSSDFTSLLKRMRNNEI